MCGIKTIGLARTTPLYLSSLAPCKRSWTIKQGASLAKAHLTNSRSKVTQTYATSTLHTEGASTQLVSKSTKRLSLLAMLNNKTTNGKIEREKYLAIESKQYD